MKRTDDFIVYLERQLLTAWRARTAGARLRGANLRPIVAAAAAVALILAAFAGLAPIARDGGMTDPAAGCDGAASELREVRGSAPGPTRLALPVLDEEPGRPLPSAALDLLREIRAERVWVDAARQASGSGTDQTQVWVVPIADARPRECDGRMLSAPEPVDGLGVCIVVLLRRPLGALCTELGEMDSWATVPVGAKRLLVAFTPNGSNGIQIDSSDPQQFGTGKFPRDGVTWAYVPVDGDVRVHFTTDGAGDPFEPGDPAYTRVAVLNASSLPRLAASIQDRAGRAGFERGLVNNYTRMLPDSLIQYAAGMKPAAEELASLLGIGTLEPLTPETLELTAEPQTDLVVVAGQDLAP